VSVARKRVEAEPTASSEYQRWRFSLDYRYGTCPSLEEAFVAGWTSAPGGEAFQRAQVSREGYTLGHAAGLLAGIEQGRAAILAELKLNPDAERVIAALGLQDVALSRREMEVVATIASAPDRRASISSVALAVFGTSDKRRNNSTRTLLNRIRDKLPKGVCIGTVPPSGYRYHVIAGTEPCPIWKPTARDGKYYTPVCQAQKESA
jgi:hypothetical protein